MFVQKVYYKALIYNRQTPVQFLIFQLTPATNGSLHGESCDCGAHFISIGATCRYISETEDDVVGSFPWITYTVLTEILMKILPSFLLVILNSSIIMKFKNSRKRVLNSIVRRNSKRMRKSGISKRDKNLVNLMIVLNIIFLVTNLPMAIARIMIGCGIDTTNHMFREFEAVSNSLEVFFASSNFYLYCLCNMQIRKKVTKKENLEICHTKKRPFSVILDTLPLLPVVFTNNCKQPRLLCLVL